MTVSDLNYPLAEVAVLIQKGSHTPDSCVPLKHQQLCGMIPYQDASKQGKLDLPAFLPAFDQSCSVLLNKMFLIHKENKQAPFTCFACPAPQLYLTATNSVTSPCGQD